MPTPLLPNETLALIDNFLLHLDVERGLSVNYQLSCRRSLESFFSWLSNFHPSTSPAKVTHAHISDYLTHRKHSGLASASIKLEAVAIRVFFRFLAARKLIPADPAIYVGTPRIQRNLPPTLSTSAIQLFLNSIPTSSPRGLRDRAIFELLYSSGLRASELCRLRLEEYYPEESFVRITSGKGAKTRLVPVGSQAASAIEEWLIAGRPKLVRPRSSSHLFLSLRGKPLTPQRLWQLCKRYAKIAGISQNVFPHLFRHSFASHLLHNGADLRAIQEMLGHADISTTQVYTHIETEHLRSLHHTHHPRSRLRPSPNQLPPPTTSPNPKK